MKFGKKLRSSVRADWPSVDYKRLKRTLKHGPHDFESLLNRELAKTSAFFTSKRAQTVSSSELAAHEHELRKWQILNYIAVLKSCKKFDKQTPERQLTTKIVPQLLRQARHAAN